MKILFYNNYDFHYEVLESIILKFSNSKDNIFLKCFKDPIFETYIKSKFPKLIIDNNIEYIDILKYDKIIYCTVYHRDLDLIKKREKNKYIFIAHEITDELKQQNNVYFLTKLCNTNNWFPCEILPFHNSKRIKIDKPIFLIQGGLNPKRRNFGILKYILDNTDNSKYRIKLLGKGNLPDILKPYKNIILKNNKNFIDFHKEILDCYCILPLISYETHKQYYTNKLTASINYANAYEMKILLDDKLQSIYNMKNAYVYNSENEILTQFNILLNEF